MNHRSSGLKLSDACAGYPFHPHAFLANNGLGGRTTVIVVQPIQHRERNHRTRFRLARR
jgi:hypothetical protein